MARSSYYNHAMTRVGLNPIVLPFAEIAIYNVGTLDGYLPTLYQAATGGATRPNPFNADQDGNFSFYLDAADDVKIIVTGADLSTYTLENEHVLPDASDILFSGRTSLTELEGGLIVDNPTDSEWALEVHGNPKQFAVINAEGHPWVTARRSPKGNDLFSVNLVNESIPETSTMLIAKAVTLGNADVTAVLGSGGTAGQVVSISIADGGYFVTVPVVVFQGGGGSGAAATAILTGNVLTGFTITNPGSGYATPPDILLLVGYVIADYVNNMYGTDGDIGCGRFTSWQIEGDNGFRALEAHSLRETGAGAYGTIAIETSVNSKVTPDAGLITHCSIVIGGDNLSTFGTAYVQASCAIFIGGNNGYRDSIIVQDTVANGSGILFRINSAGKVTAGDLFPKTTDAHVIGSPAERYTAIYGNFMASSDGTFNGPSKTYINETTSGEYRISAGVLGWTILGTQVINLAAGGLTVQKPVHIKDQTTPSAPPATFNSLYFKSTGRLHRMSSGSGEVGVFDLASTDIGTGNIAPNAITQRFTVGGSTSSPTRSAATYAVIPEMTLDITTIGGDVEINFGGTFAGSTLGNYSVAVHKDGTIIPATLRSVTSTNNGYFQTLSLSYIDPAPSAAAHTYDVRWISDGTNVVTAVTTQRSLSVKEFKK